MPRALHAAILRNVALLVPSPARAEWLAEWRAELWYVKHDATSFCLGSFHDALWLRLRSFSARRVFSLDRPLTCVLSLIVFLALVVLLSLRSSALALPVDEPTGLAVALCWMYLESLLVLLTLNPLWLGDYLANGRALSRLIRIRPWAFLAIKIVLLPPILFLVAIALASIFPPAAALVLPGLILGFRWVLSDQRQRCPVCLHFLSNPVELGRPGHMLFQSHGTALRCARGHGFLYVPTAPTSWCRRPRWQYTGTPSSEALCG